MKKEVFLAFLGFLLLVSMAGAQTPPAPVTSCSTMDPNFQCPTQPPLEAASYCIDTNMNKLGTFTSPCDVCKLPECLFYAIKTNYDKWEAYVTPQQTTPTEPAPVQQPSQQEATQVQPASSQCPLSMPEQCPPDMPINYVCGSNGVTYPNPCVACLITQSFTLGTCSNNQVTSAVDQFLNEAPSLKSLGSTNIVIEPLEISGTSTAEVTATTETRNNQEITTIDIRKEQSAEIEVTQSNGNIDSVIINLDQSTIVAE